LSEILLELEAAPKPVAALFILLNSVSCRRERALVKFKEH